MTFSYGCVSLAERVCAPPERMYVGYERKGNNRDGKANLIRIFNTYWKESAVFVLRHRRHDIHIYTRSLRYHTFRSSFAINKINERNKRKKTTRKKIATTTICTAVAFKCMCTEKQQQNNVKSSELASTKHKPVL